LRREWLRERWQKGQAAETKNSRSALVRWYGAEEADKIRFAEAFEICEYGRQPSSEEILALFPFLPQAPSDNR